MAVGAGLGQIKAARVDGELSKVAAEQEVEVDLADMASGEVIDEKAFFVNYMVK